MDEYLEIPQRQVRYHQRVADERAGIGASALWVDADVELRYVVYTSYTVRPGQDQGRDFHPKPSRPGWREDIRKRYPVGRKEHRRHIVSYRWLREFSKHLDEESLRKLGFDPKDHGGLEGARRAWIEHQFNNPENFWRGEGWVNSWLGRWMHLFEEFNFDPPSREAAERERERREREARELEEQERREREGREREERERIERERRERERRERERRERERREREQRERERERPERGR